VWAGDDDVPWWWHVSLLEPHWYHAKLGVVPSLASMIQERQPPAVNAYESPRSPTQGEKSAGALQPGRAL